MNLELLTPEKKLFSGEIYLVKVPGEKGSFEILNNHVPIISNLENGQIKIITKEGQELFFDIKNGFVEVKSNNISILANV